MYTHIVLPKISRRHCLFKQDSKIEKASAIKSAEASLPQNYLVDVPNYIQDVKFCQVAYMYT